MNSKQTKPLSMSTNMPLPLTSLKSQHSIEPHYYLKLTITPLFTYPPLKQTKLIAKLAYFHEIFALYHQHVQPRSHHFRLKSRDHHHPNLASPTIFNTNTNITNK